MGIAIKKIGLLIFSLLLFSCSLLEKGFVNSNEQYVPKKPNYSFKDKPNNIILKDLDTVNIYKLIKLSTGGVDQISKLEVNSFVKFYNSGRCLFFSISKFDEFNNSRKLKLSDLNPNNKYYNKDYYYSFDGEILKIENFVYGEGYGKYVILDYKLKNNGEILEAINEKSNLIYKKEKIPNDWNKYDIDW